jgi:hypothetical protein
MNPPFIKIEILTNSPIRLRMTEFRTSWKQVLTSVVPTGMAVPYEELIVFTMLIPYANDKKAFNMQVFLFVKALELTSFVSKIPHTTIAIPSKKLIIKENISIGANSSHHPIVSFHAQSEFYCDEISLVSKSSTLTFVRIGTVERRNPNYLSRFHRSGR